MENPVGETSKEIFIRFTGTTVTPQTMTYITLAWLGITALVVFLTIRQSTNRRKRICETLQLLENHHAGEKH